MTFYYRLVSVASLFDQKGHATHVNQTATQSFSRAIIETEGTQALQYKTRTLMTPIQGLYWNICELYDTRFLQ